MVTVDVRAQFWDGPSVAGRAVELSVGGALVFLPWSTDFTETDAMVAYSARSTLRLGSELTLPCTVRWVSGGEAGLEFGVAFDEVEPADVDALTALIATGAMTVGVLPDHREGSSRRRYLRVAQDAAAHLRRIDVHDATASPNMPEREWSRATVLDMSAEGCRVRGQRRLRRGETVEVVLESSPGVPLTGTVRWSRRFAFWTTAGLQFPDGESRVVDDGVAAQDGTRSRTAV